MAVNHKKLTSAKVRAVIDAIEALMDRTEHDDRLNSDLRDEVYEVKASLMGLHSVLWHEEFLRSTKTSGN